MWNVNLLTAERLRNHMANTALTSIVNCEESEVINRGFLSSTSLVKSPTFKKNVHELSEPPMWLRYYLHWFRIGLSIFLLLSVLIGLGGCSLNAATVNWDKAKNIVPAAVLEEVITKNTILNPKAVAQDVLTWNVQGKDGKLTIFDFNTPEVCGALGCLYTGYWFRDNQPITQVFLSYLHPNIPQNQHLFQVGEYRNQLPCFKVMQIENNQLRQLNFCFNGNNYQLADNELFAIDEEKK
jgi:hypothetical protein